MEQTEWEMLSPEEKKKQLYLNQKEMLEGFLERGAISPAHSCTAPSPERNLTGR